MSHRFIREQLYDLVWSEPMPKLAPRFGISDAALADTNREAIIQPRSRSEDLERRSRHPTPETVEGIGLYCLSG